MTAARNKIVYEGDVYVRPIGRGIVLEQEPGRPHLGEWIEAWLGDYHPGYVTGGCDERLRIVVERISPTSSTNI